MVHSLEIEGVLPADDAYLRSILRSIPGQPYSEANIAADRDSILNYYFNNGYQNATFDWTQTAGPLATQVDLHFVVRPGKQEFVRNVFVRGLEHTRAGLVARRITLEPKEPLSQDRIGESQQKLYDLGIFSKVQTAIQNPDGDEDSKERAVPPGRSQQILLQHGLRRGAGAHRRRRHHLRCARRDHRLQPAHLGGHQPVEFPGPGAYRQPANAGVDAGAARRC